MSENAREPPTERKKLLEGSPLCAIDTPLRRKNKKQTASIQASDYVRVKEEPERKGHWFSTGDLEEKVGGKTYLTESFYFRESSRIF